MGLVLAGGKSSRMGQDKALLKPWGLQGPDLLAHAFSLLAPLTGACFVSSGPDRIYSGYECLPDAFNASGPIAGILTGLQKASSEGFRGALVLACDLPGMTNGILDKLLQMHIHARKHYLATFYENSRTGTVEMLAGVYECSALKLLQKGLTQGQKSIFLILNQAPMQRVQYGAEKEDAFINCNKPDDLARARLLFSK